jgi:hypothetical protein
VDTIYLVEAAKSTDIIGSISKELAVTNSSIPQQIGKNRPV